MLPSHVLPTLRRRCPQHARERDSTPQSTRAPSSRGSILASGETGGRGPISVPVQIGGCRVRRDPQAPGQRARSGHRSLHDPSPLTAPPPIPRSHRVPARALPSAQSASTDPPPLPEARPTPARTRAAPGPTPTTCGRARPGRARAHLSPRHRRPAHFRETRGCARLQWPAGGGGAGRAGREPGQDEGRGRN